MMTASPKTLPDYDAALALVLNHVPRLGHERVPLGQVLGRVLREDLAADRDQPPFDRAAMDGFAVRHDRVQAGSTCEVIGGVAAGGLPVFHSAADVANAAGAMNAATIASSAHESGVIRIATGAPVPPPFDAVIPIEVCDVAGAPGSERVTFRAGPQARWWNIHRRASDAGRGHIILRAGTILAPHHIGIAATIGAAQVTVAQRPRITLLTTGDEVIPFATPTDSIEPQQIRNSNGPMLEAFFAALGTPLLEHVHIGDDPEQTRAAAREALSRSHLVITNGGISAGQRDWLPWAWSKLGMNIIIQGVAIQPGRPLLACTDRDTDGTNATSEAACSKLILGLPGNPVSVLATAHLFAWPVIRRMLTNDPAAAALPWRQVTLSEPARATSKRQVFRAARLHRDGTAAVIHWHGSGDLMHTAQAQGFVRLPVTDDPVEAGTTVDWLPLVTWMS